MGGKAGKKGKKRAVEAQAPKPAAQKLTHSLDMINAFAALKVLSRFVSAASTAVPDLEAGGQGGREASCRGAGAQARQKLKNLLDIIIAFAALKVGLSCCLPPSFRARTDVAVLIPVKHATSCGGACAKAHSQEAHALAGHDQRLRRPQRALALRELMQHACLQQFRLSQGTGAQQGFSVSTTLRACLAWHALSVRHIAVIAVLLRKLLLAVLDRYVAKHRQLTAAARLEPSPCCRWT